MKKYSKRKYPHYANCYYPVLADYNAGFTIAALAKKYTLSYRTVWHWTHQKTKPKWLHKIDPVLRYNDDGQLVTHQEIVESSTKEKKLTADKKKETSPVTLKDLTPKTIQLPVAATPPIQKSHFASHLLIMFLYFVVTVLACIAIVNLHKLF